MSRLLSCLICLFCAGHQIVATAAAGTIHIPRRTDSSSAAFEFIPLPDGVIGAESLAFDSRGQGPYTGVSDGRVLRWDGSARVWTTFVYSTHGRSLGLQFNIKTGDLYIADFFRGLLRVGPAGGEAEVVAVNADGEAVNFLPNGIDIDQSTANVYFTDDSSGRLMMYDVEAKHVIVLKDALPFPNGVAVSADRTHVVVAHTVASQLSRYWLKGPKAGTYEHFTDLPGYPDNIRRDARGGYWVALSLEKIVGDAGVARNHIVGLRLDTEGMEHEEMSAEDRSIIISEIVEKDDGKLWLGSNILNYVTVVDQRLL